MRARELPELKAYRERNSMSRSALAEQLGVSRITIWRWEEGKQFPDEEYQPVLAKMLGMTVPALLGFEEAR